MKKLLWRALHSKRSCGQSHPWASPGYCLWDEFHGLRMVTEQACYVTNVDASKFW